MPLGPAIGGAGSTGAADPNRSPYTCDRTTPAPTRSVAAIGVAVADLHAALARRRSRRQHDPGQTPPDHEYERLPPDRDIGTSRRLAGSGSAWPVSAHQQPSF